MSPENVKADIHAMYTLNSHYVNLKFMYMQEVMYDLIPSVEHVDEFTFTEEHRHMYPAGL